MSICCILLVAIAQRIDRPEVCLDPAPHLAALRFVPPNFECLLACVCLGYFWMPLMGGATQSMMIVLLHTSPQFLCLQGCTCCMQFQTLKFMWTRVYIRTERKHLISASILTASICHPRREVFTWWLHSCRRGSFCIMGTCTVKNMVMIMASVWVPSLTLQHLLGFNAPVR